MLFDPCFQIIFAFLYAIKYYIKLFKVKKIIKSYADVINVGFIIGRYLYNRFLANKNFLFTYLRINSEK